MITLLLKLELYQLIMNTNGKEFMNLLNAEELTAKVYVSDHRHSVGSTCKMKDEELKKSLDVVYNKFRWYFDECGSCRITSEVINEPFGGDSDRDNNRMKKGRNQKLQST